MSSPLASIMNRPLTTQICYQLRNNETMKALGVEILGINLPKTAIIRTKDEAMDVGVNEFGNTLGFFGGLWGGSYVLDKLIPQLKLPFSPNPNVLSIGRIAKSMALIPPLVSLMIAMPFLRNAFTAWHAGTTDYKNLITQGKSQAQSPAQKQATQNAIRDYLGKGASILGAGLLLGVGGFLWARGQRHVQVPLAKAVTLNLPQGLKQWLTRGKPLTLLPKGWNHRVIKAFCLTGKNATEMKDIKAICYWGIPAYLGWMAASRDGFEQKEQLLKMANFVAVYFLPDKIVHWAMGVQSAQYAKAFPKLYSADGGKFSDAAWKTLKKSMPSGLADTIRNFENRKLLTGFGLTVVLMAILPALLNIYLTKRRLENEKSALPPPIAPPFPVPLRTHRPYSRN